MTPLRALPDPGFAPVPDTDALDAFRTWRGAVDAAAALRKAMIGRRVKYVGMLRNNREHRQGRINNVTSAGFSVQWDATRTTDIVHPDSVVFI